MNKITERFIYWFSPHTDKETEREIDRLNLNNVFYASIIVGAIQTFSLVFYIFFNMDKHSPGEIASTVVRVAFSIVLCAIAFFISWNVKRGKLFSKKDYHAIKNIIVVLFDLVLVAWGMYVSATHYAKGEQILTFFTTELAAILLVRIRPVFSVPLIFGTYTFYFFYLSLGIEWGRLNPYNYFTMAMFSVAGALINYRQTVNYIEQKNKATSLNRSLEYIASHDNVTQLQNRYAFTRDLPTYLHKPLCVVMGDIDGFKKVNDTLGHQTGDDILYRFANILGENFPHEYIYRYGGDEFCLILPNFSEEDVKARLSKVNARFGSIHLGSYPATFGCSFGLATGNPPTQDALIALTMQADQALYAAKSKHDLPSNIRLKKYTK